MKKLTRILENKSNYFLYENNLNIKDFENEKEVLEKENETLKKTLGNLPLVPNLSIMKPIDVHYVQLSILQKSSIP